MEAAWLSAGEANRSGLGEVGRIRRGAMSMTVVEFMEFWMEGWERLDGFEGKTGS